jgi:ABC-type branched-subunit amino acid transport system substrate-binding protein
MVRAGGGEVVGEIIVPFGVDDYSEILDRIGLARPDAVIMVLLGSEAAKFNRAFASAGLAARVLRFGLAIDESVLYAIGSEHSENLYTGLSYFSHIRSAANDRFLEVYHESFGERAPPVNVSCQSCYDGIYVAANLARSIGRSDGAALARSVRRPAGRNAMRSSLVKTPMGQKLRVHLAAADGIEFRVVSSH